MEIITKRREARYSPWYNRATVITDVYMVQNGEEVFIKGFHADDENRDKEEMARLISHLKTLRRLKHFTFYGPEDTALEFILMMQIKGYNFRKDPRFCEFRKSYNQESWDFQGNLEEISAAFHYRIFDRTYAHRVYTLIKEMPNISTYFSEVDTEESWRSLYFSVEALVKEQMIRIEEAKPEGERLDVWLPSWYESLLSQVKKMLPSLKPSEYEVKLYDVKEIEYAYAKYDGRKYTPGMWWTGRVSVRDTVNTWRPLIEDHGALYSTKERVENALREQAAKIIGYDKQHIRELLGFREGKTAICGACGDPFSAHCYKKSHECETQRKGGFTFK